MKKNLLLVSLLLFITIELSAQGNFKFGAVSMEEMTKTHSLIDSSAGAEVLFEIGTVEFGSVSSNFKISINYTKRIKIFNESGYKYGTIKIPFSSKKSYKSHFSNLKAHVFNLENSSIKRTEISTDDLIDEQITSNERVLKIVLPKVKKGSVIEFTYTQPSSRDLDEWTFQDEIPVVWSEYSTNIPLYFSYQNIAYGVDSFDIETTEVISFFRKSKWGVSNFKALPDEEYINSKANYFAKVKPYLILNPGSTFTYINDNFIENLVDNENFGRLLKKRKFLSASTSDIINNKTDDLEKAKAIYRYIKNKMVFNNYIGIFPNDVKAAWKERSGSVPEINTLLIMMLREARLNVNPVIISTRDNGFSHPTFYTKGNFNYLIAQLKINGKSILLDASNKNYPFGVLPIKCLNSQGRIVSRTESTWIPLKGHTNSSITTYLKLALEETGNIIGNVNISNKGYQAIFERSRSSENEKEYYENIKEQYPDWNIDSVSMENKNKIDQPLKIKYNISNKEFEEQEYIYLNPIINPSFEKNPFQAEERFMPIDFPYQIKDHYILEFTVPDNYEILEIPESAVFNLRNKGATYQFSSQQVGNKISIVNKFNLNQLFFKVEEYGNIKKFFELMLNKQNQQIVLKRKE